MMHTKEFTKKLVDNILAYIKENKITQEKFMESINLHPKTFQNWQTNHAKIRDGNLIFIKEKYPELIPARDPKPYRNSDSISQANDNGDEHVMIDYKKIPKEVLEKYDVVVKLEFKLKK